MLVEAGIDPERELSIGPIPGAAGDAGSSTLSFGLAAARALEDGRIDGFWANGMGAEIAARKGTGTIILDARRGEGPPGSERYTFPALVAAQRTIDERPDVVSAAVRAVVRAQAALRRDPALATEAAKRFPDAERALIAELIRRDAPYYDPRISEDTVKALNAFAREVGVLLSDEVAYERVVYARARDSWET
jgi:NitT/TauT family transport system substrate-binding protein